MPIHLAALSRPSMGHNRINLAGFPADESLSDTRLGSTLLSGSVLLVL